VGTRGPMAVHAWNVQLVLKNIQMEQQPARLVELARSIHSMRPRSAGLARQANTQKVLWEKPLNVH